MLTVSDHPVGCHDHRQSKMRSRTHGHRQCAHHFAPVTDREIVNSLLNQ